MSRSLRVRTADTMLVAGLLTVVVAAPAVAHTTANPSTTAAGAYAVVDMRVPHGCDGAATTALTVRIPDGVTSVKPEQITGWDVETEIGPYDEPFENHGTIITEGVQVVTWTVQEGADPLPDDLFRDFGLSVKLPDTVGETLAFPSIQTCEDGTEAAWIETSDDPDAELDMPAPLVTLTAGGDEHGSADGSATEDLELTTAAATSAAPHPLTYVAVGVGVLGLVTGVAGLRASRR